jgi:D-glycero-D-manno-heptose 1,7-bisphosphate phosphatase
MTIKKLRPAVFIDRDGTLIREKQYLVNTDQVEIFKNAFDAVRNFLRHGFYVFVITNQSGVARGLFSEQQVRAIHHHIQMQFQNAGLKIHDFFFCPHHPEGVIPQYTKTCLCRKPQPGLILRAKKKYPIDLKKSYMVGDKLDDVLLLTHLPLAGGCLVLTGWGKKNRAQLNAYPTVQPKIKVAANLEKAAEWILKTTRIKSCL